MKTKSKKNDENRQTIRSQKNYKKMKTPLSKTQDHDNN